MGMVLAAAVRGHKGLVIQGCHIFKYLILKHRNPKNCISPNKENSKQVSNQS